MLNAHTHCNLRIFWVVILLVTILCQYLYECIARRYSTFPLQDDPIDNLYTLHVKYKVVAAGIPNLIFSPAIMVSISQADR